MASSLKKLHIYFRDLTQRWLGFEANQKYVIKQSGVKNMHDSRLEDAVFQKKGHDEIRRMIDQQDQTIKDP